MTRWIKSVPLNFVVEAETKREAELLIEAELEEIVNNPFSWFYTHFYGTDAKIVDGDVPCPTCEVVRDPGHDQCKKCGEIDL
jgi:hypothetical protein